MLPTIDFLNNMISGLVAIDIELVVLGISIKKRSSNERETKEEQLSVG